MAAWGTPIELFGEKLRGLDRARFRTIPLAHPWCQSFLKIPIMPTRPAKSRLDNCIVPLLQWLGGGAGIGPRTGLSFPVACLFRVSSDKITNGPISGEVVLTLPRFGL